MNKKNENESDQWAVWRDATDELTFEDAPVWALRQRALQEFQRQALRTKLIEAFRGDRDPAMAALMEHVVGHAAQFAQVIGDEMREMVLPHLLAESEGSDALEWMGRKAWEQMGDNADQWESYVRSLLERRDSYKKTIGLFDGLLEMIPPVEPVVPADDLVDCFLLLQDDELFDAGLFCLALASLLTDVARPPEGMPESLAAMVRGLYAFYLRAYDEASGLFAAIVRGKF